MGILIAHVWLLRCNCGKTKKFEIKVHHSGDDLLRLLIEAAKKDGWKFGAEQGDNLAHDLCPDHNSQAS